ncbi:mannosyltransferase complex subunit [Schizosaccharomyces japonicus yFS275]|uniref:Mannosyltransferase complex subunit n=1 Tax=Schizosaccharomyces japonicus (strain yFS275 / FY16936) TaxID=402676 RepID=B6K2Q3_SCHJY|nr:mannosyltransferase complex subunit [Schizosaccharomyces japonicus yFS275]EEB07434.1 mannosyltransferase complex subunit [Schizosaccharomyces japonicus yFS275]
MLHWKQGVFPVLLSNGFQNLRLNKHPFYRFRLFSLLIVAPLAILSLFTLWFGYKHVSYSIYHPPLRALNETIDAVFSHGCKNVALEAQMHPRMNATFVVLARNSEVDGVVSSMRSVESHFNRHFNYPYVFLNDVPFDDNFKDAVLKETSAFVEFGTLDAESFGFPNWANLEVEKEEIAKQGDLGIMYGDMESYHHMCRFFSGFFYKHPLMQKYQWYWRVEPDIEFTCDITYDPFYYMDINKKMYGFVIAIKELEDTVPNMFRYVSAYKREHKLDSDLWDFFITKKDKKARSAMPLTTIDKKAQIMHAFKNFPQNSLKGLLVDENADSTTQMEGDAYNMCHFWSNFEIANLDLFRNDEYEQFFHEMEQTGGFWRERWGDAPFHSLAAGLLLRKEQLHYFRDFGYRHSDIYHCGQNLGCNCECLPNIEEIEAKPGACIKEWADIMGGFLD